MYINRNAYIMVAVKGDNYCVAAGKAISLIVKVCCLFSSEMCESVCGARNYGAGKSGARQPRLEIHFLS